MKKIIGFAAAFFVAASAFAQFRITPNFGFSHFFTDTKKFAIDIAEKHDVDDLKGYVKFKSPFMNIGVDFDYQFPIGLVLGMENNVLFLGTQNLTENVEIFGGPGEKVSMDLHWRSGALYNANLYLAYNIKTVDSLDFILGAGIGFGFGKINTLLTYAGASFATEEKILTVGVPLIFRVNYFFTDMIGISVSLSDVLGWSESDFIVNNTGMLELKAKFTNQFNMKVGPVFKF